jgi:multidrug transporter EmrE-like cation transporter
MSPILIALLIALLSGFMSGVGGVGYKVAARGRISALQTATAISILGLAFFTYRACALGEWSHADWRIVAMGAGSGLGQYLAMVLFAWTLRRLPLSLVWCANGMEFMPVILASWIFFGEHMSVWRWMGLVALLAAIVVTSFFGEEDDASKEKDESAPRRAPFYITMAVLVAMPLCFGMLDTCMKWGCRMPLSATDPTPLMDATQNVFMALVYLVMAVTCGAHITVCRTWAMTRLGGLGCLLAAIPTVAFFGLKLVIVADAPATVTFALTSSTSMVTCALLSSAFLQEKRNACWYATLALCILAIVLISEVFLLPFR